MTGKILKYHIECDYVQFYTIKNAAKDHFYSHDTTNFFKSIYPDQAFRFNDNAWFITSEQAPSYEGHIQPRMYTIRKFTFSTGRTQTIGEFNQYTYAEATKALKAIVDPISKEHWEKFKEAQANKQEDF